MSRNGTFPSTYRTSMLNGRCGAYVLWKCAWISWAAIVLTNPSSRYLISFSGMLCGVRTCVEQTVPMVVPG